MLKIDPNRKEEAKNNIVTTISEYVRLRKQGSSYVGLCPFHSEKSPSFTIKPSRGEYKCFGCGKRGDAIQFLIDIEKENGNKLSFYEAVLRLTPNWNEETATQPQIAPKLEDKRAIEYLDVNKINRLKTANIEPSNLHKYFYSLFGKEIASKTLLQYNVFSLKDNRALFVQQDIAGNYRRSYAMPYNEQTGRRLKKKNGETNFFDKDYNIESYLFTGNYSNHNLKKCFFGEHLINGSDKNIMIVESEKTALGMSILQPQYIWIATGGAEGLKSNIDTLLNYANRVTLLPDADKLELWQEVANQYLFKCNTTLQRFVNVESPHLDIWDVASRYRDTNGILLTDDNYPVIWDL